MAIVNGQIRCNVCGETKPLHAFAASRVTQGYGECRACSTQVRREARTSNPERHRAKRRAHYRANRETYRGYNLARYGLSASDYDAILAAQGGRCACCGSAANRTGKRLFVDHDHVTGAIRGVICLRCNAGIAALGDTVEGVRRAVDYLERAQRPALRAVPALRINLLQQGAN